MTRGYYVCGLLTTDFRAVTAAAYNPLNFIKVMGDGEKKEQVMVERMCLF
jgi:hypothetical protein